MRTWHVFVPLTTVFQSITAHKARTRDGVLSFWTVPEQGDRAVLMRAYAPHAWRQCEVTDLDAPGVGVNAAEVVARGR